MNKMTELKIRVMKLRLEEIEKVLSGSIAGDAEGGRYGMRAFESIDTLGRDAVKEATRPSGTSSSETDTANSTTNSPTLTASYLATRAPGPTQLEMWARKFEQHESIAYLMERPLLSDCSFSPGGRNPCTESRPEHSSSLRQQSPSSGYPQFLDENDLVEDDEAPTIQSHQNHPLRESMIQQEENAEYTIRAPHSQQENTINLQTKNITPRFQHQDQRY